MVASAAVPTPDSPPDCRFHLSIHLLILKEGHKVLFAFLLRKKYGCVGRHADARQSTGLSERIFQVLASISEKVRSRMGSDLFWQGHKDLNPEPTVLETAALPIELYPYISIAICIEFVGGPSGT